MEDRWLTWIKRLNAIASTGVHFARDTYDRERYQEMAQIGAEMLAWLCNTPPDRIRNLQTDFSKGYVTPKVDVRGAVFEADRILLVKEVSDGLWTLPGGYADVGISPAENVAKEIWEEATLRVRVSALYGIRHKARHAYPPDARDFYKLFFLCDRMDESVATAGSEAADVGFFAKNQLPPLSVGRVLEKDIVAAFEFRTDPSKPVFFD